MRTRVIHGSCGQMRGARECFERRTQVPVHMETGPIPTPAAARPRSPPIQEFALPLSAIALAAAEAGINP